MGTPSLLRSEADSSVSEGLSCSWGCDLSQDLSVASDRRCWRCPVTQQPRAGLVGLGSHRRDLARCRGYCSEGWRHRHPPDRTPDGPRRPARSTQRGAVAKPPRAGGHGGFDRAFVAGDERSCGAPFVGALVRISRRSESSNRPWNGQPCKASPPSSFEKGHVDGH